MTVRALTIDCDYTDKIQNVQQTLYQCTVTNAFTITKPDTIIESANGTHTNGRNDSMVEFIFINKISIINYFPSGLIEVFPDLLKIEITAVELMEIHQKDLKPFVKLEFLILDINELKSLEKDLFLFNTKLKQFSAKSNQISYIDPYIFDHLNQLSSLDLTGNVCSLSNSVNSTETSKIIENLKRKCSMQLNFVTFFEGLNLKLLDEEKEIVAQFKINFDINNKIMQENSENAQKMITAMNQTVEGKFQLINKNAVSFQISQKIIEANLKLSAANEKQTAQRLEKIDDTFITKEDARYIGIPVVIITAIINIALIIAVCRKKSAQKLSISV